LGRLIGYGIIFLLIIALISWMIKNIIGVIGLGVLIFGIYKLIDNREKGYFSKYPLLCIPFGTIISLGWFLFQEIWNALGFIFFFSSIVLMIVTVVLVIKKNPQWKIYIGSSIAMFIISIAIIGNAVQTPENEQNQQKILAASSSNAIVASNPSDKKK